MEEFIARGLDKVYAKEIKEWKKYQDEKKFAVKLDKQMKNEIERFRNTIKQWELKELEDFICPDIPKYGTVLIRAIPQTELQ